MGYIKRQLAITLSILFFISLGTIIVVIYAKGYRFGLEKGRPEFVGTGLLVTTSNPDGAEVFINGHLTTATDNTINLAPGEYQIRIFKDGYSPWEKKIIIQKEVVAKADALLLSTAPTLQNITSGGVSNPTLDPSKTQLAYTIASQSARKNGIYVLDMTSRPILTLQNASNQVADDTLDSFSSTSLLWSPDGKQLIASASSALQNPTTYILNASSFNENPQDITATLPATSTQWQKDSIEIQQSRLNSIKISLRDFISKHMKNLDWSFDQTKLLYIASDSASFPLVIQPRMIGTDSTDEERDLKKGSVYIYDFKEDKNYKILDAVAENTHPNEIPFRWFPDSKHLAYLHDKKIDVIEYDGQNQTTVYAGPFTDSYVFPWPNGVKILILTNLGNPNIPANLYTIDLK